MSFFIFLPPRQFYLRSIVLGLMAAVTVNATSVDTDILIVGGNESGCAAAIQVARLGVQRIVLVNDISWLGGQFSSEGVGPVDERTEVAEKSVNFPRSGLFLEMVRAIRAYNSQRYGLAAPGNSWSAMETIEPAAAEKIFEQMLVPYSEKGTKQISLFRGWYPSRVFCEGKRVIGVEFERHGSPGEKLTVRAKLTMDASDWGDVIRLSGAEYYTGVDPKSRFGESRAPEILDAESAQEMNAITWTATLRETDHEATIPKPPHYYRQAYDSGERIWIDSAMPLGFYSSDGISHSTYTHRRLVDRYHNGLPFGTETIQLNTTVQDYPLCQLPKWVIERLETLEKGASRKNIVDMTIPQREIIFNDAKERTLGFLYYLQTELGEGSARFRKFALSNEFGTPDRLPPKPYVREGLRLKALYMLCEEDVESKVGTPQWPVFCPDDAAFGFQFRLDFHPTRRRFLDGADTGAWQPMHTKTRIWDRTTNRVMCPFRCFVPIEYDGLLGTSKNIGVSSIVQSALRLHGQMMLAGQTAATLAWLSLQENRSPREILAVKANVRKLQTILVRGVGGPGVAIWPWQDLEPDAPAFEAANFLPLLGIWHYNSDDPFFHPQEKVTGREFSTVLSRLCKQNGKEMKTTGIFPDKVLTWCLLYTNLTLNGFSAPIGLTKPIVYRYPLLREEFAEHLYRAQ